MESPRYIWQLPGWPGMRYDGPRVAEEVARSRRVQGMVEGKLQALGCRDRQELAAEAWTQDAVATAAIEGERLDLLTVRSSVARRLGGADDKGAHAPRHDDGLLDIMEDAVTRAREPLGCDMATSTSPRGSARRSMRCSIAAPAASKAA